VLLLLFPTLLSLAVCKAGSLVQLPMDFLQLLQLHLAPLSLLILNLLVLLLLLLLLVRQFRTAQLRLLLFGVLREVVWQTSEELRS
jgi:hypothetical protein